MVVKIRFSILQCHFEFWHELDSDEEMLAFDSDHVQELILDFLESRLLVSGIEWDSSDSDMMRLPPARNWHDDDNQSEN
ncbi:MAG: hypothetical protein AAF152_07680 [Cyanobacteria bacterium P01_A01_bin.114]